MTDLNLPTFVPPIIDSWSFLPEQQMFTGEAGSSDQDADKGATPKDGDQELGDSGKAALKAERDRANKAEKELAKFQKAEKDKADAELPEIERLRAQLAEAESGKTAAELASLKYRVGVESKLPPELIARLQGSDEATLKADATELAKLAPGYKAPKPDPSQGPQDKPSGATAQEDFEDTIDSLFDN
jgi:hypothetical protein